MDKNEQFKNETINRVKSYIANDPLQKKAHDFMTQSLKDKYSYNFTWLGRPIIQHPQDIVALQEIIWETRPDLIIETGIAHGGSLILSASILELVGHGEVLGIDIDIREHNKKAIENHPFYKRINMIQGSSISDDTLKQVNKFVQDKKKIMVILDSNHTHDHVLEELRLYSPFVSKGCYLVVYDTVIEFMPEDSYPDRPWDIGANPLTALNEFMKTNDEFEIDEIIENKILLTAAPKGYLKKIK